jgi:hypothetical protein
MVLPWLEFQDGAVTFCDERDTSPGEHFISVTVSGEDSGWGEFLSYNEALALKGWLDVLLADESA